MVAGRADGLAEHSCVDRGNGSAPRASFGRSFVEKGAVASWAAPLILASGGVPGASQRRSGLSVQNFFEELRERVGN